MEKKETSIGAVVINSKNQFLLILQRKADYWECPKGHMEGQEDELVTMDREVKEETGIKNFIILEGFREEIHYSFERDDVPTNKTAIFYLVKTDDPIDITLEHKDYKWVDYEQALKLVEYENQRIVLRKAHDFIKNLEK
nr:NUDIX domain-containing protein [Nanoarchaeota archaeon]